MLALGEGRGRAGESTRQAGKPRGSLTQKAVSALLGDKALEAPAWLSSEDPDSCSPKAESRASRLTAMEVFVMTHHHQITFFPGMPRVKHGAGAEGLAEGIRKWPAVQQWLHTA